MFQCQPGLVPNVGGTKRRPTVLPAITGCRTAGLSVCVQSVKACLRQVMTVYFFPFFFLLQGLSLSPGASLFMKNCFQSSFLLPLVRSMRSGLAFGVRLADGLPCSTMPPEKRAAMWMWTSSVTADSVCPSCVYGSMASAFSSAASMISRSPGPLSFMPQRWSMPWMMTRCSSRL